MSEKFEVMHILDVPNEDGNSLDYQEYDERPSLEQMQSWTKSGMIELVTIRHQGKDCHAIIDENGKFDNTNNRNQIATSKWWHWLKNNNYASGNDTIVGKCSVLLNFELE
tara:strand:- start:306 stop:635 length:330 start_codon:yes stop_codon:yes gene_type:complete